MVAFQNKLNPLLAFAAIATSVLVMAGCKDPSRGQPLGSTLSIELTIDGEKQKYDFETLNVPIGDRTFTMKLALTDQQRFDGLSHMTNEQIGDGMLFAFRRPRVLDFVMRDCLVPIDIVFVSPTGRVIETHEMQVPAVNTHELSLQRYPSRHAAIAALEFQAGTIKERGIKPGQSIDLPIDRLKQRAE